MTESISMAAFELDTNRLGAAIIILAVVLGVLGMIVNGILRARSVKKSDQATHDRIEKALHSKDAAPPKKVAVNEKKSDKPEA